MAACPICKKNDAVAEFKPFCCKRCANVDLHRWMGGQYAIPAVEPPDDWEQVIEATQDGDTPTEFH